MKKYCALLISHGNPCIFHPLPNIPQVSARSQTYLLRLYSQIRERKRDIAHCPLFDVTKCTGSETGCLSKRSPPKKIESSPSQISWLVSWVTQVIRSLKTRFLMMERIGKTLKMMESKIYSSISRPSSTTITKVEWLLEPLFTDKNFIGYIKWIFKELRQGMEMLKRFFSEACEGKKSWMGKGNVLVSFCVCCNNSREHLEWTPSRQCASFWPVFPVL